MKRLSVLALPLIALTLAACGSSSSSSSSSAVPTPAAPPATSTPASSPPSSAASGAAVAITMKNIAFSPVTVHAKVGQTVVWTNEDQVAHNVTPVGGPSFTASSTFGNGATFKLKLDKAGTITYRCTIHPGMNGTIVVTK
jgi:plastocyanin